MNEKTLYVANCDEFKQAFEKLKNGGTIVLTNTVFVSSARLAAHSGVITVTGKTLSFEEPSTITLGGNTVFENITVDIKTIGMIAANFNSLTLGKNVTVNCDFSEEANGLYLIGGEHRTENRKDVYTENTEIAVYSGKISRIIGFSASCDNSVHTGCSTVTIGKDAYVRYYVAGATGINALGGSASLTLSGNAVIEAVMMGGNKKENFLSGDMNIFVSGGDIFRFDYVGLTTVKGKRNLLYVPEKAPSGLVFLAGLALFDSIKTVCDIDGHSFDNPFDNPFGKGTKIHKCANCGYTELIGEAKENENSNVVFVADNGFGNGSFAAAPIGDYDTAIEKLGDKGGTIVLVGKCTLPVNMTDRFEKVADAYQEKRHSGMITVTSIYGGVDYRKCGASLVFAQDMDYRMSGPETFENVIISANGATYNRIIARYNPLVIGEGVETPNHDGYKLDIIGGYLKFRYTDLDGYKIENEFDEIVNSYRPLPADFVYDDLVPIEISPRFTLRKEAAEAFNQMFRDMKKAGLKSPYISDASRTYERQYQLFTNYICRLRRTLGYDFETARKVVLRSCSMPLCSEHHRGVAVDMYDVDLTQFGGKKHHYYNLTPEWAWVCENGVKYGIILRYPASKTDITGTIYETWHFSYVGKTAATVLKACGYVMEEYMGAKLGLFNQNSNVIVKSGTFNSITPFSLETDNIQFTGSHVLSVSDTVKCYEKQS